MARREQDRTWDLGTNLRAAAVVLALTAALTIAVIPAARAQTYIPLHHFKNTPTDGSRGAA